MTYICNTDKKRKKQGEAFPSCHCERSEAIQAMLLLAMDCMHEACNDEKLLYHNVAKLAKKSANKRKRNEQTKQIGWNIHKNA